MREMAVARGAAVVIDVRTLGRKLFYAALDGTTPDNARWIECKSRTVEHFRRSSYALGLTLQQAGHHARREIQPRSRRIRDARRRISAARFGRGRDRLGRGIGSRAARRSPDGGQSPVRRARRELRQSFARTRLTPSTHSRTNTTRDTTPMRSTAYMLFAIVAEVVATSALRASDGFTRAIPAAIVIVGYGLSFYLLSLTLRALPVGVVYAVWSGPGIVLITVVAALLFKQTPDLLAMFGMGLIVAGVVVLNAFWKMSAH
ncbi:Ethidium bromide-methyl viologen resistance protein EmrE [Candidatus Paraburkholderia kirkii UZHbot1]|uniref:Ethidium bromide-methyl viologen resistance protein EmrE n=1 Tax=Candidatus Paraburkholderia kirkii UZHbot1 TaxID=1055526 RepID=G4MJW9_9BURK|nr:Ethidium bromide-methyl viologen resistance protein EmrE [Candidatus Paraburkholderia kirkii UZHbot1]